MDTDFKHTQLHLESQWDSVVVMENSESQHGVRRLLVRVGQREEVVGRLSHPSILRSVCQEPYTKSKRALAEQP